MCGIVGYVGHRPAMDVIISGLQYLEYRGYDSAGVAIHAQGSDEEKTHIHVEKAAGKLDALRSKVSGLNLPANSGIGHTRWATHGAPTINNAHPHRYGGVCLVHNGIIENHVMLKDKLKENGHIFYSDTDTEVAAHLLNSFLEEGFLILHAISKLCDTIHGAYSFGIIVDNEPDRVFFAKRGSPLLVAKGDGEAFLASDQAALVDHGPRYYSLEDHEIGYISTSEIKVFSLSLEEKPIFLSELKAKKESVQKMGHAHFMHKEIFEQAQTIDHVSRGRVLHNDIDLNGFGLDFERIARANRIQIVACGSAFYAGLLAKGSLEEVLGIPVMVEIASEYRYRKTLCDSKTLVIAISQSGETVDTLEALKKAMHQGSMCMSVCNVQGSAIAALCERSVGNLLLNAGPEISVASTKAFVAQLVALRLFMMAMAKVMNKPSPSSHLAEDLLALKQGIEQMLGLDQDMRALAKTLVEEERMLYLGRGDFFPVALEGALKMKELTYISAEGYPAGELKHGPIAIIDPKTPAVVLMGSDTVHQKTISNMQEVKARGAKIIVMAPKYYQYLKEESHLFLELPPCPPLFEPIASVIPLQLLAYHLSDLRGIDVDKPRNLAKSVTVE